MFKTYRFRNLQTDDEVRIVKLSYLWACLFGPAFVAFKAGASAIAFSLVLSLACSGALLMLLINLNRVPKTMQPIALIFGIAIMFFVHSTQTVSIIVKYYRKQRRWSVRTT
jgi:hypothetical protein